MARRENEERNNFQFIGSPKPSPFTPGGLQPAPQLSNYSTVKRSIELVKVMSEAGEAGERGVIDSLPLKKSKKSLRKCPS
jgi:hypothetical protein